MIVVALPDSQGVLRIRATHFDTQQDAVGMHPDYAPCKIFYVPDTMTPIKEGDAVPMATATLIKEVGGTYTRIGFLFDEREWVTDANGMITCTWLYAFKAPPILQCTAVTPAGATKRGYLPNPVDGATTNTGATIAVFKLAPTTLGAAVLNILGAIIDPQVMAPQGIKVNVRAKGLA